MFPKHSHDRCFDTSAPKRVLVVDDLPASRLLLLRVLTSLSYDVSLASDGDEAWRLMVSRRPFDLILTDLEMPSLNGLQLTRKMRQCGRADICEKPVIIHSSTDPAQLRDPIASDPLTFCLPKPLEVTRLKEMLGRVQATSEDVAAEA